MFHRWSTAVQLGVLRFFAEARCTHVAIENFVDGSCEWRVRWWGRMCSNTIVKILCMQMSPGFSALLSFSMCLYMHLVFAHRRHHQSSSSHCWFPFASSSDVFLRLPSVVEVSLRYIWIFGATIAGTFDGKLSMAQNWKLIAAILKKSYHRHAIWCYVSIEIKFYLYQHLKIIIAIFLNYNCNISNKLKVFCNTRAYLSQQNNNNGV